jgi:hypothetical protein
MKLKKQTAINLKSEFEVEGNLFLFKNIFDESTDLSTSFEIFKEFSTRYLYYVQKIK